jgi:hypothetical protein
MRHLQGKAILLGHLYTGSATKFLAFTLIITTDINFRSEELIDNYFYFVNYFRQLRL